MRFYHRAVSLFTIFDLARELKYTCFLRTVEAFELLMMLELSIGYCIIKNAA